MRQVVIGARVNMCTTAGLVNGAMGTITGIESPEGQQVMSQQPCGINILFDDESMGRQMRGTWDSMVTT